jgi:hypothetical protein
MVAPGRIETSGQGRWDTLVSPPPGEDPLGDGFVQARGLGFVEDTLTISAGVGSGFLQVALVYSNDGFSGVSIDAAQAGTATALYDIYYRFGAGAVGAETSFVDYNRRLVSFGFSSGTGFTTSGISTDLTTGNFASGQVFLVPFTTGEALSILLTGDCTGTVEVSGFAAGAGGCGPGQRFGWGGIIGATDADGNAITLNGVSALSGANYFDNLAGLAFEPVFGVPEPAIWAQFILGFGLAGILARRRRALAA